MPDEASDGSFWEELAAHHDPDAALGLIARHVADVIGDGCVLTTVGDDGRSLVPRAITHTVASVEASMEAALSEGTSRIGEGVAGTVAADRRAVVLNDLEPTVVSETTPPQFLPFVRDHPMRALMVAPIVASGELIGTLGALRTEAGTPYTDDDLAVLVGLADRAATTVAAAVSQPTEVGPGDYEAIFRQSLDGILLTAADGRILAANPAACELLGRSERALLRADGRGILDEDDPATRTGLATRARTGHVRGEFAMRRSDGSRFVADLSSTIFTTPSGEVRASVIFRDVTDEQKAREHRLAELEASAHRDALTTLLNRHGFLVAAEQALAGADREGSVSHLVFLDVDDLKALNDEFGHVTGDEALAALGLAISRSVRHADVACRYGGDEFVLLLMGADEAVVLDVVDRIRRDQTAHCPHGGPCLTFSAGFTRRPAGDPRSLATLIDAADQAMYRDKVLRRLRR